MALVLLAGAAAAVYSRAIDSPFVFDDDVSIVKNPSIVALWPIVGDAQHPAPLSPPKELPNSGRPLVNLTMAINYHFGQFDPAGYHLFNLIVHVFSAWLLMAIVRRTLCLPYFKGKFDRAGGALAFVAALLWTLHPLQTETVVYITQRTELMVGFFYLATIYASLRYWAAASSAARKTWLALTTLACLAGMACKEVMVSAPVIVLLFERTFIAGSFPRVWQRSWPLYIGLFLGWGLLLYLHHDAPRSTTAGFDLGIAAGTWWLTQAKVLWTYLKLTVWPWPQSIHYEMPYLTSLDEAWPWVLASAILALATLFLLWRRTASGFVFASVLIILSPTLVIPIITEMAAERRMYLPLAALITWVVAGGYQLILKAARPASRTSVRPLKLINRRPDALAGILALILAVVLAAATFQRLAVYHDDLTLWQDVLNSQPGDYLARFNLGNALSRADRTQEAAEQYQIALHLQPSYADAHNNLGLALGKLGDPQAAIDHFQEALKYKPTYIEAWANMALAQAALNHPDLAVVLAQKAIDMARSKGQIKLAQEVEAWLTTYRASLSNQNQAP